MQDWHRGSDCSLVDLVFVSIESMLAGAKRAFLFCRIPSIWFASLYSTKVHGLPFSIRQKVNFRDLQHAQRGSVWCCNTQAQTEDGSTQWEMLCRSALLCWWRLLYQPSITGLAGEYLAARNGRFACEAFQGLSVSIPRVSALKTSIQSRIAESWHSMTLHPLGDMWCTIRMRCSSARAVPTSLVCVSVIFCVYFPIATANVLHHMFMVCACKCAGIWRVSE